jgi:hypothetical protein
MGARNFYTEKCRVKLLDDRGNEYTDFLDDVNTPKVGLSNDLNSNLEQY